ncbi:hydroxymethylbilane synthase [Candidatus Chlamydia sanziniae]|uniref:hydroxymethylbilane synthase n=1 Tax=Candidatus Chlamydia sanziniae TaxID=1806891 RepID=A0A1A9HU03_9CHLA|nr:hydroxymethylbilane synthase [Candidatus Chlamydia sanziniae]ANH78187.1 Porphobilinogen deaminase [Candidatus Chlamydia sanziniae]
MLSACYADPFLSNFFHGKRPVHIASRSSNLAKMQVYECLMLLRAWYPKLRFHLHTVKTEGDRDKKTSLRCVENTHFFTGDVDALVHKGICHFAVHSAKDLPRPSPLPIVALTRCLHPADLLIYGRHYHVHSLPHVLHRIGSSSIRRTEILKQHFPQAHIMDIRGTIEERLQQLKHGRYDAIVLAKAASLRLHLHRFHSIELPPPYHPLQGSLAITALTFLDSWKKFFAPLHKPTFSYS